mgnify:CR=1 FL=1
MSIKSWAAAVGLCATILVAPQASASDHNDGAAVKQDPSTDIADLYAWMSPGAAGPNRMYMIMTVNPAANKTTSKFSTTAVYVFHTRAKAAYTDTSASTEINIMCTFDAAQTIECWAGDDEYVPPPVAASQFLPQHLGAIALVEHVPAAFHPDAPVYRRLAPHRAHPRRCPAHVRARGAPQLRRAPHTGGARARGPRAPSQSGPDSPGHSRGLYGLSAPAKSMPPSMLTRAVPLKSVFGSPVFHTARFSSGVPGLAGYTPAVGGSK